MISTTASYDDARRCTWEGQPDSVDVSEALTWYLVEAFGGRRMGESFAEL